MLLSSGTTCPVLPHAWIWQLLRRCIQPCHLPHVQGYVERVQSLATYKGVIEDVLSRWAYPCVPDNSGAEHDSCRFNRGTYV